MELIVSKRFTKAQFYGSYVLSKLDGNFAGSYRTDNFQTDPNISSMFDFTNSDGKLTGQDIPGVLGTDRTHQFKLFGNYMWKALNSRLELDADFGYADYQVPGSSGLPGTPEKSRFVKMEPSTPAPADLAGPSAGLRGSTLSTFTPTTPGSWVRNIA